MKVLTRCISNYLTKKRTFFKQNRSNGFHKLLFFSNISMPNRLSSETSPYLLQHAHQHVDWYPWGDEALNLSKRENKLIFLSIGYSTCHWCHVMSHECFDDPSIAALLNKHFVSIKVDREERPDVDQQYMNFVVSTTGHGGWPLSIFCTPGGKPILGGTYFPPVPRRGAVSFPELCRMIHARWQENPQVFTVLAEKIQSELLEMSLACSVELSQIESVSVNSPSISARVFQELTKSYDKEFGGFGNAPKFPQPSQLHFLLSFHALSSTHSSTIEIDHLKTQSLAQAKYVVTSRGFLDVKDCTSLEQLIDMVSRKLKRERSNAATALDMVSYTLERIVDGGIHDILAGGFHRYSVDKWYHVPHFEKMLYDQGQLMAVLADAYKLTNNPKFSKAIQGIQCFLSSMFLYRHSDDEIAYYSALDADSIPKTSLGTKSLANGQSKEGSYYVWTFQEFETALKDLSCLDLVAFIYDVRPEGNVQPSSDPMDELHGQNVLIQTHSSAEIFARFPKIFTKDSESSNTEILDSLLAKAHTALLAERKTRPMPHLDRKILAAWNGYVISGLTKAYQALQDHSYKDMALQCGNFIVNQLITKNSDGSSRLLRSYNTKINGVSLDYAACIDAFIHLYECSFDEKWLKLAIELQKTLDVLFWDSRFGGYFTAPSHPTGLPTETDGPFKDGISMNSCEVYLRLKEESDGAEPYTASLALRNLIILSRVTDDDSYLHRAEQLAKSLLKTLSVAPSSLCHFVSNLPFLDMPFKEVKLVIFSALFVTPYILDRCCWRT